MLRRCVKLIPHPDSLGFHHKPLKAPGTLAVGVEPFGGRQIWSPGTVATHLLLLASTGEPVAPLPMQNVAPATCVASTLLSTLTVCLCAEVTLPAKLCRLEAETCCSCPDGVSCARTRVEASLSKAARFTSEAGTYPKT